MMELSEYIAKQLNHFFPIRDNGYQLDVSELEKILPIALARMEVILNSIKIFNDQDFDRFNSIQYAALIYLLANESWKQTKVAELPSRLFYLNKTLNSIELFYSINLPPIFFISHGVGSVLGKAEYGNRLVVFQNVTVGRIGNNSPTIKDNVVLYPNSVVSGASVIGKNSVISAGVVVHNKIIPDNSIVYSNGDSIIIKEAKKKYIDYYMSDNNA